MLRAALVIDQGCFCLKYAALKSKPLKLQTKPWLKG